MAPKDPVVLGYAQAIFAIAQSEEALRDVEDELFRFSKIVEGNASLREALTDIALPAERKKAMLGDLLEGKVHPQTIGLIAFVIEQGHARELAAIIVGLAELVADLESRELAEVRAAVPLTDSQQKRLAEALSKALGRKVGLKVLTDPSVIGGVVVRVGDKVLDGSVKTRIEDLRQLIGSS